MPKPDLIILGQVTVDDVVPAAPGPWRRQMGGSSLYAAAGARHWIDPAHIGLVACVGRDYPFDVEAALARAGIGHVALRPVGGEHLVEWLIYEEDGSRRSMPRNARLREVDAEGDAEGSAAAAPYTGALLAISPSADAIPAAWLPARALHLCPQAGTRHGDSLAALAGRVGWISVDPSPRYSRAMDAAGLARLLAGAAAFLPSEHEVRAMIDTLGPEGAARALAAGFPEVVLKRGAQPAVLVAGGSVELVAARPVAVADPTGAGDAFCGAYAACRLLGLLPAEAARRAAASAAAVVGSSGAEAALACSPL